ncbi:2-C-methyl-D-erythritol 2,4-cyclodiphosphate synthase [Helicobacter muridarum]|uniref:2-C-methyl-D-erythritol 2,4-cyclodiphosphate synthase n=1 Tax=Helicobacter muridarum TaxID=216 RepID=A0A4U8TJJ7_9HELI|nr:2-C-methyl-D-erythritol 2,4-cyclodiphosphate synthase [Helicobacter muridarum]
MQTISIIIMAAGDSTRFCNYDSKDPCYSNSIQTKKQWLRIGSMPLWLIVAKTIATKCLTFCCNKELLNLIAEYRNDLKNQTNQYEADSINRNYTPNDIHETIESLIKDKHQFKYRDSLTQILNKPMLTQIIITASPKDKLYMQKLLPSTFQVQELLTQDATLEIPMQIVQGGDSRYMSLQNALDVVDSTFVLVNDCARCNVKESVLSRLFASLAQNKYDCIAPCLPIHDTTIYVDQDNKMQTYSHIDRNALRIIQTPQISKTNTLRESKALNQYFSDETSAICAMPNKSIGLVLGDLAMNKITTKQDIFLLKEIYESNQNYSLNTPLVGMGSDIHAFEESKEMWICGVKIESSFGFKAHSDGDVGIHAIIDSILGAMCYGDIGEIFPDTNKEFKDIDSKILLKRVYDYCLSVGLEIGNIDITIIAQTPRISTYKSKMQETIAKILYLQKSQVSIKASTAENLGFIGRKEGVLAQCIATLQPRELPK